MNTALFNTYLEEFWLPTLTPGQVVIMDNATFHQFGDTHRLITGKILTTNAPYLNEEQSSSFKSLRQWLYQSRIARIGCVEKLS